MLHSAVCPYSRLSEHVHGVPWRALLPFPDMQGPEGWPGCFSEASLDEAATPRKRGGSSGSTPGSGQERSVRLLVKLQSIHVTERAQVSQLENMPEAGILFCAGEFTGLTVDKQV